MKTAYQILTTPLRSAVVLSAALSAVLVIFSVFAMFHFNHESNVAMIPLNTLMSLLTVGITLLPGLFFRIYCYSSYQIVMTPGEDLKRRQRKALAIDGAVEFLYLLFILNAYMSAIASGGTGFLGLLAIAAFNLFGTVVSAIAAAYFYFRRGKRVLEAPPKVLF